MKERPILFSAPMVMAILAGTKTQTRRVVKPRPPADCSTLLVDTIYPVVIDRNGDDQPGPEKYGATTDDGRWCLPCPYGQPGDRLWVREAWARDDEDGCLLFRADNNEATRNWEHERIVSGLARYRWRPSIHMFRWASRITLEITGMRVERLQDISEADAIAEGLTAITKDRHIFKYGIPDMDGFPGTDNTGRPWHDWNIDARVAYRKLWEQINGPGSWDANPWVWVVEFKRIKP